MNQLNVRILAAVMLCAASAALASDAIRPTFTSDGVVKVPAFELPPSSFMSKEAAEGLKYRAMMAPPEPFPDRPTIQESRAVMEQQVAPMVQMMRAQYPVSIVEQTIAGVKTRIFTPKDGKFDPKRVLINLHGGAFQMCAEGCALIESIPITAEGGFKVISVDYRQGPEALYPAATEDVVAVYRELLKSYKPKQIGIYGCSAGGILSGQVAAWLPKHGLPQAGAIGIFGAGAARMGAGDSAYLTAYIDGGFPPPSKSDPAMKWGSFRPYFQAADLNDPMVLPADHPDVLAKFPPTLVITGSRAPDMSPAIYTNSQLLKAGVDSRLIVGEGLGHCYIYQPHLPESQDAYDVIVRFFKKNLE